MENIGFSILVPSYNRPDYLTKTVDSILDSSYSNFELIVSDDNSPKQEKIRNSLSKYIAGGLVQYHQQSQNLREAKNREFLLEKAKNEWSIVIGDDDLLHPTALADIAAQIEQSPSTDIHLFGYDIIDENDKVKFSRRSPESIVISLSQDELLFEFFGSEIFPFWMYHPATFCIRREIAKSISCASDIGIGDDFMFLFDAVNRGYSLRTIPKSLFQYRKFSADCDYGQTNQSKDRIANAFTRARILENLESKKDLHSKVKKIVNSNAFRRKFLYQVLFFDKISHQAIADDVRLTKKHIKEYKSYAKDRMLKKIGALVQRVVTFFSIFKFNALPEIFKILVQRARS